MATVQDEKDRCPIPGEGLTYPVENWTEIIVEQKSKKIKLASYLYPAEGKRRAVFLIFHGLNSHIGKSALIA